MSDQQFSTREREAFWKIYGRKCFYDGKELLLEEMELDHIIPEEWLTFDKADRGRKLVEIGLPSNFDIGAYENIVASCGPCNGKKGSLIFHEGQVHITLARAKENAPKVREKVNRRTYAASKERLLVGLVTAIDAGNVSGHEIVDYLKNKGYLGFMSGGELAKPLPKRSSLVFPRRGAAAGLQALEMRLTIEEMIRIIDSNDTQVLREQIRDGQVITEIRHGDMYFKYEVRGDRILIISAHLTR